MSNIYNHEVDYMEPVRFHSTVALPASCITDAKIEDLANLDADKLQHRHAITYGQKDGTDVAAETKMLYTALFAGSVKSVKVRPRVAPDGGDKVYTVDVQKAVDGSNTWASILTAVITLADADSNDTLKSGTVDGADSVLAVGDTLRVVVAVAGSTGNQGQGFVMTMNIDENGG